MESLKAFWNERAPRERAVLGLAGFVIVVALILTVLLEPALKGIQRLERGLPNTRAQAAQLDALLSEVQSLKAKAQVARVSAQEARAAMETSLSAAGLKATRVTPLSDTDIQLSFKDVPYAAWATWLATTEKQLGARTISVVANGNETPGNANIEVALRLAR